MSDVHYRGSVIAAIAAVSIAASGALAYRRLRNFYSLYSVIAFVLCAIWFGWIWLRFRGGPVASMGAVAFVFAAIACVGRLIHSWRETGERRSRLVRAVTHQRGRKLGRWVSLKESSLGG